MTEIKPEFTRDQIRRIVGAGTTPDKVHREDWVIYLKPQSPSGWSTQAMIRSVGKSGVIFLTDSLIPLGTVVRISCPGGSGHSR